MSRTIKLYLENGEIASLKDVCKAFDVEKFLRKNCLDKQRVKEAIEKVLKNIHEDEWQNYRHYFSELEEELGVDRNISS